MPNLPNNFQSLIIHVDNVAEKWSTLFIYISKERKYSFFHTTAYWFHYCSQNSCHWIDVSFCFYFNSFFFYFLPRNVYIVLFVLCFVVVVLLFFFGVGGACGRCSICFCCRWSLLYLLMTLNKMMTMVRLIIVLMVVETRMVWRTSI